MELEYLIILNEGGIPIFSKCFGGFCLNLSSDPLLLSGFLAAVTTLPQTFSNKEPVKLNSIEMGQTKLFFHHINVHVPLIICAGFNKNAITIESQSIIDNLFVELDKFLSHNYNNKNLNLFTEEEGKEFEHLLYKEAIDPWINRASKKSGDICTLNTNCPFPGAIIEPKRQKQNIWTKFKNLLSYPTFLDAKNFTDGMQLVFGGVSCIGCIPAVEEKIKSNKNFKLVSIDYQSAKAIITTSLNKNEIQKELTKFSGCCTNCELFLQEIVYL